MTTRRTILAAAFVFLLGTGLLASRVSVRFNLWSVCVMLGGLAAHYVAGLSWPVSWVLGAILVVTGPTVILPLLRQARLNKDSAALLKWEGIVNDPVGVLLAVLTFQYFTLSDGGWAQVALGMGSAIAAAAVLGGLGGWATGWMYWTTQGRCTGPARLQMGSRRAESLHDLWHLLVLRGKTWYIILN